jgi:hypothetical protein
VLLVIRNFCVFCESQITAAEVQKQTEIETRTAEVHSLPIEVFVTMNNDSRQWLIKAVLYTVPRTFILSGCHSCFLEITRIESVELKQGCCYDDFIDHGA